MPNSTIYGVQRYVVDQLFADACALPSWSGEMGEALIACADKPREVINRCFDLLDASPVDDSPLLATIELHPMDDASRATWQALPDDIRELVADIVAAAASARKPSTSPSHRSSPSHLAGSRSPIRPSSSSRWQRYKPRKA